MNLNWTNRTRPSLLVSPASGKASPNMNHGVIRVTSQAPQMHWATPEQREAVVVGVQKQLSDLDCAPQLTRHPWQLHAALHQQQQYLCLPLPLPLPLIAQGEISMSVAFPTHVWKKPNIFKHIIVWFFHTCVPFPIHVCQNPNMCGK